MCVCASPACEPRSNKPLSAASSPSELEAIMIGEQTRTYLLYSRGLMPDDLTLGSLHLDPANPIDNESKFFHNDAP